MLNNANEIVYPLKCQPIHVNWHPWMLLGRLRRIFKQLHLLPSKYNHVNPYKEYYPLFRHLLVSITKHSCPKIRTCAGCCVLQLFKLFVSNKQEFVKDVLHQQEYEIILVVFINQLPYLKAFGKHSHYELILCFISLFAELKMFQIAKNFPNIDMEPHYFKFFATFFDVASDGNSALLYENILTIIKQMLEVSNIIKPSIVVDFVMSKLIDASYKQQKLAMDIIPHLQEEQLELGVKILSKRMFSNQSYPNMSITGKEYQIFTVLSHIYPEIVPPVLNKICKSAANASDSNRKDALMFLADFITKSKDDSTDEFSNMWNILATAMVSGGISYSMDILLKYGYDLVTMKTIEERRNDINEIFQYHFQLATDTEKMLLLDILIKAKGSS